MNDALINHAEKSNFPAHNNKLYDNIDADNAIHPALVVQTL